MPTRMIVHFAGVGDAMRLAGVRAALRDEATRVAARARAINDAERIDATVTTESGTRPSGRPYGRVLSTAVAAEFGTSKTARRRVLGRAAEQGS